jgi:hypothetical protein
MKANTSRKAPAATSRGLPARSAAHAELADDYVRATRRHPDAVPLPRHVCACGYATGETPDLDDHLLIVFIAPDGIGSDGDKHVLLDPSTPDHWRIVRVPRD